MIGSTKTVARIPGFFESDSISYVPSVILPLVDDQSEPFDRVLGSRIHDLLKTAVPSHMQKHWKLVALYCGSINRNMHACHLMQTKRLLGRGISHIYGILKTSFTPVPCPAAPAFVRLTLHNAVVRAHKCVCVFVWQRGGLCR
jgi:hypothetical protein